MRAHSSARQDGASPHTAKVTKQWFVNHQHELKMLAGWPPNSPDLNPIENLWAYTVNELSNDSWKNLDELHASIDVVWGQIDVDTVRKFTSSFRKRLLACVKANGGHTKY